MRSLAWSNPAAAFSGAGGAFSGAWGAGGAFSGAWGAAAAAAAAVGAVPYFLPVDLRRYLAV